MSQDANLPESRLLEIAEQPEAIDFNDFTGNRLPVLQNALGGGLYDRVAGDKRDRPNYTQELQTGTEKFPWEVTLPDGRKVTRVALHEKWGSDGRRTTYIDGDKGDRVVVKLDDFNGLRTTTTFDKEGVRHKTECPLDEARRLMTQDLPNKGKLDAAMRDFPWNADYSEEIIINNPSEGDQQEKDKQIDRSIRVSSDRQISPVEEIDKLRYEKQLLLYRNGQIQKGSGEYAIEIGFVPQMEDL